MNSPRRPAGLRGEEKVQCGQEKKGGSRVDPRPVPARAQAGQPPLWGICLFGISFNPHSNSNLMRVVLIPTRFYRQGPEAQRNGAICPGISSFEVDSNPSLCDGRAVSAFLCTMMASVNNHHVIYRASLFTWPWHLSSVLG